MSRSQSPPRFNPENLTVEEKGAIEQLMVNCFEKVPCNDGAEDASNFSDAQLKFMRDNQPVRYDGMDFIHLSDERIRSIVLSKHSNPPVEFPFSVRRKSSEIRNYASHNARTADGRNAAKTKSLETLHSIAKSPLSTIEERESACLGLSLLLLYDEKQEEGFKALVRIALRNKAEELKKADSKKKGHNVRLPLLCTDGFILEKEDDLKSKAFAILKLNGNRADATDYAYNAYSFCSPKCTCAPAANKAICTECLNIEKAFRKRCMRKGELTLSGYKPGRKNSITFSSPDKMKEKSDHDHRVKDRVRKSAQYYKHQYHKLLKTGIDVCTDQAELIFDDQTEKDAKKVLESEFKENDSVTQKELLSYLCKQTWENVRKAKKCGKRTVRYCPIILKFATFVRSKMGNTAYNFLADAFTLPSSRTLNNYNTFDTNSEDGIMHETIRDMESDFNAQKSTSSTDLVNAVWRRKGVLKFDEMKIKEKVAFNPHTNEIIGFDSKLKDDVLEKEIKTEIEDLCKDTTTTTSEISSRSKKPNLAKQILVFMFILWDSKGNPMKRVVARYSVGKSNGEVLCQIIEHVICGLAMRGFIVNQVTSDGATENVSAMKQLATLKASEMFDNLCSSLPGNVPVAFPHPVFDKQIVFIGGEMPHWVKKFINAMENSSSSKSSRNMCFKGGFINLNMVEKVWREMLGGYNCLRLSKLTDEHFMKNTHSRMRVHLAVQVLSNSVYLMLTKYCEGTVERQIEYKTLITIVEKLNNLVDIWNSPTDKTFKCESNGERYGPIKKEHDKDIQDHKYIKYLQEILVIFTSWKKESEKNKKKKTDFMPSTLYDSFCWIVYGIMGVASQIPDGAEMMQCRGGTDDVEQEFARNRAKNCNPTIADVRGTIATGSGVRGSDFTKNLKNNTGGDGRVFIRELWAAKKKRLRDKANAVRINR